LKSDFYYSTISKAREEKNAEMGCFKSLKFWKTAGIAKRSYKKYFEVPAAMHKAEIKESFTGKQQEHKGKQNPGKL
jgi:hypothetical protein